MPAPMIRIAISGPRRAGKSVVAARLQRILRQAGIGFAGPEDLPPFPPGMLDKALAHLAKRGLSVEFVEIEEPAGEIIECRPPERRGPLAPNAARVAA